MDISANQASSSPESELLNCQAELAVVSKKLAKVERRLEKARSYNTELVQEV